MPTEPLSPSTLSPPIEDALTALVMDCPELAVLEASLTRFNIFRVLNAERNELRHSSMLAWLFQPEESHGLGPHFLRQWLSRLMQSSASQSPLPAGWMPPAVVEKLAFDEVDVLRELDSIDVLIVVRPRGRKPLVVCVENKVDSSQHSDQLERYRCVVEARFPDAERRIYVFLTKNREEPASVEFIPTDYHEVAAVLTACLAEHGHAVGPEPLLLLRHYRHLIESFMEDNESTRLAQEIYRRHRRALDFIFDNVKDPVAVATEAVHRAIERRAGELGVVMDRSGQGWIRFLPRAWDLPQNCGSTYWGPDGRHLLVEISLVQRTVELQVTVMQAPEEWSELVWRRASSPPFRVNRKRPAEYFKPYKIKSAVPSDELLNLDEDDAVEKVMEWLAAELKGPPFQEVVRELAALLPKLGAN